MKDERPSLFSQARYHFHNLLVKGTIARIKAFTIVTVTICLILALILSLVPGPNGDLLTSIWNATLCALDGGTIAGMEGNTGQKAVLFVITLFGIVFSSVLVGIITTGIEEHLDNIAHSGSKVLERRPHMLVLGYSLMTAEILRSLSRRRIHERHEEPVVVLEDKGDVVEIGKDLDFKLRMFPKTKTIFRQGCPYNVDDLNLCSIERAHSILVTAQSDEEAIKTVLVCSDLLQRIGREIPLFVVCENENDFSPLRDMLGVQMHFIDPDRMLTEAVETLYAEHPSTQIVIAGDKIEVSDQTSHVLIAANDNVEREESDDLVIRSLLDLSPVCEKRRKEGRPLEITSMLYFEKNVEPAERAGADEAILVGHLLADAIGGLMEQA